MVISLFVAKILGLFLLILGVAFLLNLKEYRKMAEDLVKERSLLMCKGVASVVLGAVLVVKHNVWNTDWTLVITILGWVWLAGGALSLLFPRVAMNIAKAVLKQNIILAGSVLMILAGAYLAYVGFLAA
jgi:hypothetical protein